MKSLKELIDIKNRGSLNESFKSSIMKSMVKSIEMMSLSKLADIFADVFHADHFEILAAELLCNVADVFEKYSNSDESDFEEYKKDIFEVFSPESINKIEDQIFDKFIKEGNLGSIGDAYKNHNTLMTNWFNFKYYKAKIIRAFSEKFNDRDLFDENGNKKRGQATFELAEFTDDMFEKYSLSEIAKVKPGLSPMIVTNFVDEVCGVSIGHDVLFSIDPYTIVESGEELMPQVFTPALRAGMKKQSFPLKMHIKNYDTSQDSSKNYNDFIENKVGKEILSMNALFCDFATRGNKTNIGMPNKSIMRETILQAKAYIKTHDIKPLNNSSFTYDSGRNMYDSVFKLITTFLLRYVNPSTYMFVDSGYVKATNPFAFTVCVDNIEIYGGGDKKTEFGKLSYKRYLDILNRCGGYVYVLKKDLYKEKKNKSTGLLEPVNKKYVNTEKFTSRKEWHDYLTKEQNANVENVKRYTEILKARVFNNAEKDVIEELSKLIDETKVVLNSAFKISRVVSTKIYDYLDPVLNEPNLKNNYGRLNTLYGKEDKDFSADNYGYSYITRNSYSVSQRSDDEQLNYATKLVGKTSRIMYDTFEKFSDIQSHVITFLGSIIDSKNPEMIIAKFLELEKCCDKVGNGKNSYRNTSFKDKIDNFLNHWKAASANIKEVCFGSDLDVYNSFVEEFEKFADDVSEFYDKYKEASIKKTLKNTVSFLQKLRNQKNNEENLRTFFRNNKLNTQK